MDLPQSQADSLKTSPEVPMYQTVPQI